MKKIITLKQWLKQREPHVRLTSLKTYKSYEKVHIIPFFGKIKICEINENKLKKFRCKLEKNLAPKTIRDIERYLVKILKDAKDLGYIEKIPEPIKISVDKKEKEILTANEQKVLYRDLGKNTTPKSIAILLASGTGLRLGEVMGLQIRDIDLVSNVLYIRRSRQRVQNLRTGRSQVINTELKSRKSRRDIPINSLLRELLTAYLDTLQNKKPNTPLIANNTSSAFDNRTIQSYFTKLKKYYDWNSTVTFHSLRHSFATRALEMGVDIQALSELMGHASVSFTLQCYGHCVSEHKRLEMEKMAKCW